MAEFYERLGDHAKHVTERFRQLKPRGVGAEVEPSRFGKARYSAN